MDTGLLRSLVERVLWDRGRWSKAAGLHPSSFKAPILPDDSPHHRAATPEYLAALADGLSLHADECRAVARALRKEATRSLPDRRRPDVNASKDE